MSNWIGNTIGRLSGWELRFMGLAQHISSWSKDPSTKVGAVITDEFNRVVSLGFNGFPRGVKDDPERLADRDTKLSMVVHGDANAILFAGRSIVGCVMYTYPFPPCSRCAGLIIQSGIKQVIAPEPSDEILARWEKDLIASARMFDEADVGIYLAEFK